MIQKLLVSFASFVDKKTFICGQKLQNICVFEKKAVYLQPEVAKITKRRPKLWHDLLQKPDFNYGEFATIRNNAGLNNFKISVKEFVERTGAICLQAKAGRYGGTYAHKDIAFEFAMWISPTFKFYIVRDYQQLKEKEQNSKNEKKNEKENLTTSNDHLKCGN